MDTLNKTEKMCKLHLKSCNCLQFIRQASFSMHPWNPVFQHSLKGNLLATPFLCTTPKKLASQKEVWNFCFTNLNAVYLSSWRNCKDLISDIRQQENMWSIHLWSHQVCPDAKTKATDIAPFHQDYPTYAAIDNMSRCEKQSGRSDSWKPSH